MMAAAIIFFFFFLFFLETTMKCYIVYGIIIYDSNIMICDDIM